MLHLQKYPIVFSAYMNMPEELVLQEVETCWGWPEGIAGKVWGVLLLQPGTSLANKGQNNFHVLVADLRAIASPLRPRQTLPDPILFLTIPYHSPDVRPAP